MKIKDQIRSRRDQLGISVPELAKRVGVSLQAVRHWEAGRSFPSKSKSPAVEDALSFRLDWTEGITSRLERPDITALLDNQDVDILMSIRRLPEPVKKIIVEFAKAYLEALEGRTAFVQKLQGAAIDGFSIREDESKKSTGNGPGRKTVGTSHLNRKRAS